MKNILKTKIEIDSQSLEPLLSFIISNCQKKEQDGENDKKIITYVSLNRPVDLKEATENLYEKLKKNRTFEKYFCNESFGNELKNTVLVKLLYFAFNNWMEVNEQLVEKFLRKNTVPSSRAKVRATFITQNYANNWYVPYKKINLS